MSIELKFSDGTVLWKYENKTYSHPAEDAIESGGYIYITLPDRSGALYHTVTDLKGKEILRYSDDSLVIFYEGTGNEFPLHGVQSVILRGDDICIMLREQILIFTRGTENVQTLTPPNGCQFRQFRFEDELTAVCTDSSSRDAAFRFDTSRGKWEMLTAER